MRYDTSFHHKLKESHTKVVKDDDTEVETGIWDNATAGVMGEELSSEIHGIIFESLRNRTKRRSKTDALNSFIRYMKLSHGLLVGKYSDEKELERDKDLAAGLEALIQVGKSSFWGCYDGSSILFWR